MGQLVGKTEVMSEKSGRNLQGRKALLTEKGSQPFLLACEL